MSILKPSFYKQTDSRWAKKGWRTTDGGYSTIGVAGCGSTSVANIVNALVKPITPPTVFKYACQKGYQTGNYGLYRSAIPKLLTKPCTIKIPKFMIDCCTQVSTDKPVISRKI